ncbi:MAG: 2Fe-2S iron-sulfur cluster-binding protein [Persicimonas sp.]
MGLLQLFPARHRRRLRSLKRAAADVATALRTPRRPVSRSGALTDADLYRQPSREASPTEVARDLPIEEKSAAPSTRSVTFAHLNQTVEVEEGQTILEAGLKAGLPLDSSCRVGGCAACALQIIEGEVVYDQPICLSDEEVERGMCLACVGRPRGELVVASL